MPEKVRVILVTDGDRVAQHVVEEVAKDLGLRCISASAGNPTPISGQEIVTLLKTVHHDPVLVMVDDRGRRDKGQGEEALEFIASHPDVDVLGVVAVASNTTNIEGIAVDACITADCKMTHHSVDKYGEPKKSANAVITGDTVDVLNHLDVPVIIGVGDVGKMDKADDIRRGCPVTRKAVEEILKRSGIPYEPRN